MIRSLPLFLLLLLFSPTYQFPHINPSNLQRSRNVLKSISENPSLNPSSGVPPMSQPIHYDNISRLHGSIQNLQASHVIVIGLGGVGSWVVESLARTAIGSITLIDLDDICSSNLNRQIWLSNDIGKFKCDVLKERCMNIDESIKVNTILDFINDNNLDDILTPLLTSKTIIIDTIDSSTTKASLISYTVTHKIPIITCGSAGGLTDPSKIVSGDLTKVEDDRLLFWTR